ncbi:hypothetical protein ACFL4W_02900 [Planctomycetota bacterium]
MRRIAVITTITCLWCLILLAIAGGLIFGHLEVKGGTYHGYATALGLIIIAVLAFLHQLLGMIGSGLLAVLCILVEIARIEKEGQEGLNTAWIGLVVAAFGVIYVFNWFWKRAVLKEMNK